MSARRPLAEAYAEHRPFIDALVAAAPTWDESRRSRISGLLTAGRAR